MAKTFLYRQIADSLMTKIVSGALPPGASLPPVSTLCREYGVSHITILRALELLARRGAIIKRPRHACTVSRHFGDKQQKVRFIGGLLRHFSIRGAESYFNDLISGARREAAVAGYGFLLPPRSAALRHLPTASGPSEILDEATAIAPQVAGFLVDSLIDFDSEWQLCYQHLYAQQRRRQASHDASERHS